KINELPISTNYLNNDVLVWSVTGGGIALIALIAIIVIFRIRKNKEDAEFELLDQNNNENKN
ncbi:MAG: GGIII-like transmembrane region-containing protein, partial [Metamycoplasmataceae bacterium]